MESENNGNNATKTNRIICQYCNKKVFKTKQDEHNLECHYSKLSSQQKAKIAAMLSIPRIRTIFDYTHDTKILSKVFYDNVDTLIYYYINSIIFI